MSSSIVLTPIGVVRNAEHQPVDRAWRGVLSRIELDASRFDADSLRGLEEFSHVEVVFALHRVAESDIHYGTRHPRGRTDWPAVGIFAQRGKDRPNRIGITVCRLVRVQGLALELEGLDAIDGSPVVDIKPYMTAFAPRGEVRQPAWAIELMSDYWE